MQGSPKLDVQANWDDFRIFLVTAKAGSFSGAARQLRSTQPTVSRRIDCLERRLAVRLFDRRLSGVALTADGESVLKSVRQIEQAVGEISRNVLYTDAGMSGEVSISLPDGFATFWFAPNLGRLHDRHPGISVEFICSTEPSDPMALESDLSIRFRQPKAQNLIVTRLGYLHAVPWAAPGYLERQGTPSSPEDLRRHRLLDHEFYHYISPDCDDWLTLLRRTGQRRIWTNSSASLLSAAQAGSGIALLPTYFCRFAEGILPLDLGIRTSSPIYLTFHPKVRDSARARAVIDWIRDLFDPEAQPWFREAFHPPEAAQGNAAPCTEDATPLRAGRDSS